MPKPDDSLADHVAFAERSTDCSQVQRRPGGLSGRKGGHNRRDGRPGTTIAPRENLLGAIGALVRTAGGAVTGAVIALIVAPPLIVQLTANAASWIPNTLNTVVSGVTSEVGVGAAIAALAAWVLVPAVAGVVAVQRRDVV